MAGSLVVVVGCTGVVVVLVSSGGTEVGDGIGGNVVMEAAIVESSVGEAGDGTGRNMVVVASTGNEVVDEIIGGDKVVSAVGDTIGGVAVAVMD